MVDKREELLRPQLLIGRDWISDASGGVMEHVNPATGQVQQIIPVAGREEVNAAVAAASSALPDWRSWTPDQRGAALRRIADGLRSAAADLSTVVTLENGTPVRATALTAVGSARHFDYYAGWTDKVTGSVYPVPTGFDYTIAEPYGVVAALHAWNSSLQLIAMKLAPALAAGCTVVLKAPELAPFSAVLFGQICMDAGLPPGVVNVISGGPATGDMLVRHPAIDKVSFTGGPEIARRIQAACAESLTPVVFELGGKSANLIFEDADLDRAVEAAITGFTTLCGQACVAPTRLLVHKSIYSEVQDRIAAGTRAVTIGDPFDPKTTVGPLISAKACERVLGAVQRATADGSGRLILGGQRLDGDLSAGYFVSPSVFADVHPGSDLSRNEIFGPVLSITPFGSEAEAVTLANDSPFGLAAYAHTRDLARAHRVAAQLDAGNVSVNGGIKTSQNSPVAPFGGFKDSGYGKEGGREGLSEFQRIKNVNITF